MKIYEDTTGATQKSGVIISIGTKEAKIFYDVFKEYCENNKRKKIVKGLLQQMYNELPQ